MTKVVFRGGPYDGAEAELPFVPTLLIGENAVDHYRDNDGKEVFDLRVKTYVYHLTFPSGEEEPVCYQFRTDRPRSLEEWLNPRLISD